MGHDRTSEGNSANGRKISHSHDKVVSAVADGKFVAGAANASVVDKYELKQESPIKFHRLKEITMTVGHPWVANVLEHPGSLRTGP